MTKTEFELLLQVATQDIGFTIRPYYNTMGEPYKNVNCSYYAIDNPVFVYLEVNLKKLERHHIPEIVELAKEKRRETILKLSDTNKPKLGEIYTHDRYSLLWYDADGNLIPISDQERGFLVSLVSGDHSAWRPYIDYLSENGLDLQPRLLSHYLQQYERIMSNASN